MSEKKPSKKDEVESLKEELVQISQNHLRLQAEFANYKRRNETLTQDSFNRGVEASLSKFIEVQDDFDLALANKTSTLEDFKKGVELVYAKLLAAGEEFGLKHIDCLGKEFDPRFHEALLTEVSDKPENEIIEELQKGYIVNENVLRHSKVKVAKKGAGSETSAPSNKFKGKKNE